MLHSNQKKEVGTMVITKDTSIGRYAYLVYLTALLECVQGFEYLEDLRRKCFDAGANARNLTFNPDTNFTVRFLDRPEKLRKEVGPWREQGYEEEIQEIVNEIRLLFQPNSGEISELDMVIKSLKSNNRFGWKKVLAKRIIKKLESSI